MLLIENQDIENNNKKIQVFHNLDKKLSEMLVNSSSHNTIPNTGAIIDHVAVGKDVSDAVKAHREAEALYQEWLKTKEQSKA